MTTRALAFLLCAVAPLTGSVALAQDSASAAPAAAPAAPPPAAIDTIPIDRIVAVVGEHPILLSDVLTEIAFRRGSGMPAPKDSAEAAALTRRIIDEMVDVELLVTEAKRLNVEVTDAEVKTLVDQRVADIRKQFKTEAELREALRSSGQGTLESWRKELTDQARKRQLQEKLLQTLKQEEKLPPVPVSEKDIEEAFRAMEGERPKRPATVAFRQIIISPRPTPAARAAARLRIDSLRVEIESGADFEQVAKRASMDGSAQLGGDLGWIRRGKTVPAFEQWLFGPYALRPGRLSPVVETPFGFHLIRVDRVQPGEVKARHILIMPRVDSADLARARVQADSVVAAWRAGADYDALRKAYHDDAEQSLVADYPLDQLPPAYQAALDSSSANQIIDPFPIDDPRSSLSKLVIAQVLQRVEGGEFTIDDVRARFRQQLGEERAFRRYLDNLREQIYVDIRG
ncbi:MAG: peptidylprolyl isomerase [Gemmatimonadaceae bacterium]